MHHLNRFHVLFVSSFPFSKSQQLPYVRSINPYSAPWLHLSSAPALPKEKNSSALVSRPTRCDTTVVTVGSPIRSSGEETVCFTQIDKHERLSPVQQATSFSETTFFWSPRPNVPPLMSIRYFYFCTVCDNTFGETVEFVVTIRLIRSSLLHHSSFTMRFSAVNQCSSSFTFTFPEIINNAAVSCFLTDSCCCWHFLRQWIFADNRSISLISFSRFDDGNGSSCFPASCASAACNISHQHRLVIVIDNVRQIVYSIKSAGSHVGLPRAVTASCGCGISA